MNNQQRDSAYNHQLKRNHAAGRLVGKGGLTAAVTAVPAMAAPGVVGKVGKLAFGAGMIGAGMGVVRAAKSKRAMKRIDPDRLYGRR